MQKILKFLFIPGLIFAVAGFVAGVITKTWTPLYLGLIIVGGICLVAWLFYLLVTGRSFWQKRSTQAGTNAVVSTVSVLVILGLINFLIFRYTSPIDLTDNQIYSLSPQSKEIIQNLEQPLKVFIFDKELSSTDRDLLDNYKRYNNNFSYELVDPDIKVGLTQQFNAKSLGDVYLEYGDKKQLVQTLIAFGNREPLSEIELTNAIEKIQKETVKTIYLLQGHGEYSLEKSQQGSLSEAVSSLKSKGYNVDALNLAQSPSIPSDADVIIIASPKRELFEQEVQALVNYSNQGGNLFLLLDPNTDPGLEPLLKDWGIQLDNRLIIDGSGAGNVVGLGPTTPFITTYGNHPITQEFSNGISFYPVSRPIDTVEVEGVTATSLLVTSEQMWAESDLESEEVSFDETDDIPGPFDLGVALTRKIDNPQQEKESSETNPSPDSDNQENPESLDVQTTPSSETEENTPNLEEKETQETDNSKNQQSKEVRLVIIGNSTFATDSLFNQQLNGDVFLNSVQWLANENDQSLSIRPKEVKNRRINLTPQKANLITILSLVIVPGVGLVAAAITWWRRR